MSSGPGYPILCVRVHVRFVYSGKTPEKMMKRKVDRGWNTQIEKIELFENSAY